MGLTERTNVSLLLLHEFDGVSCTVELLFNKVAMGQVSVLGERDAGLPGLNTEPLKGQRWEDIPYACEKLPIV